MSMQLKWLVGVGGLVAVVLLARPCIKPVLAAEPKDAPASSRIGDGTTSTDYEWQVPREHWKMPFKDEQPIRFVNRSQSAAEWDKLPRFWNETTEKAVDPKTGRAGDAQGRRHQGAARPDCQSAGAAGEPA